jgi:hypothetical protein
VVHPADIQDRDGGGLVLSTLFGLYPFLEKLFADGGYQGPKFKAAQKKALPFVTTEIVKRSDQAEGFEVIRTKIEGSIWNLTDPLRTLLLRGVMRARWVIAKMDSFSEADLAERSQRPLASAIRTESA